MTCAARLWLRSIGGASLSVFLLVTPLSAQQATKNSQPEFFPRYDFHLSAASLAIDDDRFSWDTHFGGDLDFVDYGVGRTSARIDYEAVLGHQLRAFDPNQGNYLLELSTSGRVGGTEIAGVFHHVSRHLGDRAKAFPIDWNAIGGRVLRRLETGGSSVNLEATIARVIKHDYVDYRWTGNADGMLRRSISKRAGVFVHGSVDMFGVDGTVAGRGTQVGGLIEAGVRLNGPGGAVELFAGYESRVDANPLDRQSQHWALAGFRFASPLAR
jgi:hypothetical protein